MLLTNKIGTENIEHMYNTQSLILPFKPIFDAGCTYKSVVKVLIFEHFVKSSGSSWSRARQIKIDGIRQREVERERKRRILPFQCINHISKHSEYWLVIGNFATNTFNTGRWTFCSWFSQLIHFIAKIHDQHHAQVVFVFDVDCG